MAQGRSTQTVNILRWHHRYTRHRFELLMRGWIKNLFGTNLPKNALVSYVTKPFTHKLLQGHTNIAESHAIARVFRRLGCNVDVADYFCTTPLPYAKYDVIFGFGMPLESSFRVSGTRPRRIFYGTTCHPSFNNMAEIRRILDVQQRRGCRLAPRRLIEPGCSCSSGLADALIVLGNSHTANTYRIAPNLPIYSLNATAFLPSVAPVSVRTDASAPKAFLWIGSTNGGIHKGLDLCLESFAARSDLTLHICGRIDEDLRAEFARELARPNIFQHGFLDTQSASFENVVRQCAFAILPSCSEGQSTSLLTGMSRGLIPIATAASGIDIEDLGIRIEALTVEAVGRAVQLATQLPASRLQEMAQASAQRIEQQHTLEHFEKSLETLLRPLMPF